jgi:hypothetical protein
MNLRIALCLFLMMMVGSQVLAVHGNGKTKEKTERTDKKEKNPEQLPMDQLSLWAYILSFAGMGALFFSTAWTGLPALALLTAGFIMGLIGVLSGRNRYKLRRGKGLAIAAMVIGGILPGLTVIALLVFLL